MRLQLSRTLRSNQRQLIRETETGLPAIVGSPVSVSAKPSLRAWRGQLLSGQTSPGTVVYAASFVRERRIVLGTELFRSQALLRLILVHEVFHFAWPRLSNAARAEYIALLDW